MSSPPISEIDDCVNDDMHISVLQKLFESHI